MYNYETRLRNRLHISALSPSTAQANRAAAEAVVHASVAKRAARLSMTAAFHRDLRSAATEAMRAGVAAVKAADAAELALAEAPISDSAMLALAEARSAAEEVARAREALAQEVISAAERRLQPYFAE